MTSRSRSPAQARAMLSGAVVLTLMSTAFAAPAIAWMTPTAAPSLAGFGATPATPRPPRPIPVREPGPPALSSELVELLRTRRVSDSAATIRLARLSAEGFSPIRSALADREVPVSLRLVAPSDIEGTLDAIVRLGGTVRHYAGSLIEANVPVDRLLSLAATNGVQRIDQIRRARLHALTSAGVAIHGADAWQLAGYRGDGIRIGIIDRGFQGVSKLLAAEFPGGVQARCYSTSGAVSSELAPCEAEGEDHGTAVAETIADMAPGATLYVANPVSFLEERQTVAWMTGQGVRIINASFGSGDIFEGPGDGTSPHAASFYAVIDAAVQGGALWVNSAGNSGDTGWTGPWTDANDNGWLEFAAGDEANTLALTAGESIDVAIRWSDPWGASANDYDLYFYSAAGADPVARSTDDQAGTGDPVERLTYTAPTSGSYEIRVAKHAGSSVGRIQLLVQGATDALAHQVAADTLPSPADGANPGMLSVGAVNAASPDTIEPYSSRGPTLDGRTKPDLVAADCAATNTFRAFCGTSQSAPYVSGAAALLLQADPTLDPARLAAAIRAHTTALGSPVPNDAAGWGRLTLGPPPGTAPPPPPPPPVIGPPPLGLKALSSTGAALTWRGLATSGSAIVHVVYAERSAEGDSVVYRRSNDGGASFGAGAILSTGGVQAGYAAVASAGVAVHVAWLEGDLGGVGPVALWYRSSLDGGLTWATPKPLSPVDGRAGNPSLAADAGGHVLATWTDGGTGRVFAVASADGGTTFGSPRAVGSTTLSPFSSLADLDGLPAAAFGSGGRGYVAWSASPTRILVRRTNDGGTTWLPVRLIDGAADGYSRPWLSAYGGAVIVAYGGRASSASPAAAFVRRSTDGGSTWQERRLASAVSSAGAFDPAATLKGAVIRLVFAQCTAAGCTRSRLWYRQSANGGATWSSASALTGTSTFVYPTGLAATGRILVLYDAATSSDADTATAYLRIR